MVRVLITVEPRMVREALALTAQRRRPEAEVMLMSEGALDRRVGGFDPHVLVRDDSGGAVPEWLLRSVVCRVEVLYTDSMATRVSVAGREPYEIEDACIEDLLALVDEAEKLASEPLAGV